MKSLLVIITMLMPFIGNGQSADEGNLRKYWNYRDQLRKRFMKIGDLPGESIPCSVIIPQRQYGQSDQSTGSIMVWRDATITLGYYWSVLATEYKLLSQNGQDVQPTLHELYYAMVAFNRLDMTAEGYLEGNLQATPSIGDLNGFFIRDDVQHQIMDNFDNDPAITNGPIQPDPGHPNQMRSDFEGWTNYDTGGMGDEEITTEIQPMSSASLDQLTTVLLGLRLIERLVPNVYVKPTQADAGFYIHDECLLMIKRIVEYLNDTNPNAFGQFSAKEWTLLQGVDETVHNAGYNCIIASYPITEMVKAIFDTPYSEMIGEPGEVRWQFREGDICIEEVNLSLGNSNGQGIDDSGLVDFIENTINGIDDSGFGRAAINALAFGGGNAALGALLTRNEEVVIALATQGSVWGGVHCGNPDCCEAVDGPVILELPNESIKEIWEAFEIGDFPYHANGAGSTTTLVTGHITFKIDGLPFNMPVVLPLKASEKMVDDDNVHIMLELATLGNTWGPSYVRTCAQNSHFHHIPLLYDVLHNNPNPSNNKPKSFY